MAHFVLAKRRLVTTKNPIVRLLKFEVSKGDDTRTFRLDKKLTRGESDFNQFVQLRNQLVLLSENFGGEQVLSPIQIPKMSKETEDQLKMTGRAVNVVDCPNRKMCVTMLHYNVHQSESSYGQVRLFARAKEDEKFNQNVNMIYKLEEFFYLLAVLNSVHDEITTDKSFCKVLKKFSQLFTPDHFSLFLSQDELELWKEQKPISKVNIKVRISSCCTYKTQQFSQKHLH